MEKSRNIFSSEPDTRYANPDIPDPGLDFIAFRKPDGKLVYVTGGELGAFRLTARTPRSPEEPAV